MQITAKGIGKTYDGDTWAVRKLDLTIPSGSIFGLIGPNGAGKSTTLRMLATVMSPTEGSVAFDGEEVKQDDISRLRRQIGFLGDGNPLYKHMTPTEYLRFFGQCFQLPARELESSIAETLETFDLTSKHNTPTGSLSKGMRQRLLIARCLLHKPRLLILDEPADGLDPRGRSDLRNILLKTRERGVTVLVSSHILRELDDLCDQVAIIQRGELVVAGDVGDIIDRYEVSRLVYQIRVMSDVEEAKRRLARHRVLIEGTGTDDGLATISIQVQGDESLMADVLADLVANGVRVVTVSRLRSRLEDVYNRISDNRVN